MKKIYWYSLLLLLVLLGTLIERQRILNADPRDYRHRPYVSTDTNVYTWQTYQVMSNDLSSAKIYTSPPTNLTDWEKYGERSRRPFPPEDFTVPLK